MNAEGGLTIEIEHESLSVDASLCHRVLTHVFRSEGVEVERVTLIQAGHNAVRRLNRTYLDHDFDTDVLAFRYSPLDLDLEGEIYVDLDTAFERHAEFDASFQEEVMRYAIHGALHLTGHSDDTLERKRTMHELEDRYLTETDIR